MIRFADKEKDEKIIHAMLLADPIGREKLNIRGYDVLINNDRWGVTFVEEDKGQIRGFIKLTANSMDCLFYISELYVFEKYRHQGVGSTLLCYGEIYGFETWPSHQVTAMTIENKPMERLLQKSGYKRHGIYHDLIYRNGKYLSQAFFLKKL